MPKFRVHKRQDAFVRYSAIIEAETAEAANEMAKARTFTGWEAGGVQEYDDFEVIASETEELRDETEEAEDSVLVLNVVPTELDIIIAALRLWQRESVIPCEIAELAREHNPDGMFLTDSQIDDLIERINS